MDVGKGAMSATDFIATLAQDPEHAARQAEFKREQAARIERERAAARPLFDDLRVVGFDVQDLYRMKDYVAALPVLYRHLGRLDYPDSIRAALVRLLAIPEAGFAWDGVLRLYRSLAAEASDDLPAATAATLARLATAGQLDELRVLVRDRSRGGSRIMLYSAFMRLRAPDRWVIVESGLDDPELEKEARHLLAQRARREARNRREVRLVAVNGLTLVPRADPSAPA